MAQIVTITNPLTGQPTQVDQLEHTAQQIDDGIGFESTDYPDCYYRMVDGVVEWLNPPMVINQEYRTTERWNGKPVYTMFLECGKGPTADGVVQKTSGLPTNVDQFVSVVGSTNLATSLPYVADAGGGGVSNFILVGARSGSINIYSKGIDISSQTCYVRLKYTKK